MFPICLICKQVYKPKSQGTKQVCRKESCRDEYKKWNFEPNVTCKFCGKDFYLSQAEIKPNSCCSRKCLNNYKAELYKGAKNPNYGNRGEKSKLFKGYKKIENYISIYKPEHPYNDGGYVLEHRLVAEKYLLNEHNSILIDGKMYLKRDFVVHHKDENKHNNCVDNLQVMTRSEHTSLHNLERQHNRCPKTGRFLSK